MKMKTKMAFLLTVGATAFAGCGGSETDNTADIAAIEQLVADFNQANERKDGAAVCDLFQPSTFFKTFGSKAKCARETDQIFAQSKQTPKLVIEDIAVEGTTAAVTFIGRTNEAPMVKEGGSWYIALESDETGAAQDSNAEDGG
jgi:hypothetical protein